LFLNRLQPLIYQTPNLLGAAGFPYGNANAVASVLNQASLNQSALNGNPSNGNGVNNANPNAPNATAAAAHFANAYDLANQYNQIQLDAVAAAQGFPYQTAAGASNSSPLTAATLAAAAAASNPNNLANYAAYGSLGQHALPSLTAYQQ
jgi:hypothetical protein